MPILVPGIGTQGGDLAAVLADGPATGGAAAGLPGRGLLVNVSRGIARAALDASTGVGDGDLEERLARAARAWAARLPVLP
jgi:orotidine-5'-phosphate decarboxylase